MCLASFVLLTHGSSGLWATSKDGKAHFYFGRTSTFSYTFAAPTNGRSCPCSISCTEVKRPLTVFDAFSANSLFFNPSFSASSSGAHATGRIALITLFHRFANSSKSVLFLNENAQLSCTFLPTITSIHLEIA